MRIIMYSFLMVSIFSMQASLVNEPQLNERCRMVCADLQEKIYNFFGGSLDLENYISKMKNTACFIYIRTPIAEKSQEGVRAILRVLGDSASTDLDELIEMIQSFPFPQEVALMIKKALEDFGAIVEIVSEPLE